MNKAAPLVMILIAGNTIFATSISVFANDAQPRPSTASDRQAREITHLTPQQWNDAKQLLLRETQLHPTQGSLWIQLGVCYMKLGDYKNAERCFAHANTKLALTPKDLKTSLIMQLTCQHHTGDLEAIKQTRKIFALKFPNDKLSNELLAENKFYESDFSQIRADEKGKTTAHRLLPWFKNGTPLYPIKVSISESQLATKSKSLSELKSKYIALTTKAFNAWQSAIGAPFKFDLNSTKSDAQIACEWTNNPNEKQLAFQVAGHCSFVEKNNDDGKFRIVIFVDGSDIKSDEAFYRTCLHEIGHALGLGHSSNPDDVMYFALLKNKSSSALSSNDVNRAKVLYSLSKLH